MVYKLPRNVSKKFQKYISSKTGDIHIFAYFSKETRQLTDWQTYKNLNLFGNGVQTYQECLQKVSERYIIQNRRYPYIGLISVRKWPTNRLTDKHEICNFFEMVYKHPRNVSKKLQKDISSRTRYIPILPNFSEEVAN